MSRVCRETGVVTRVENRHAHVKIERVDACQTCEAKGACHALGGQARDVVLRVENSLGAAPGDLVVLEMLEVNVIKASAAVYLIPAAALVAGALLGAEAGPAIGTTGDLTALAGAVLGLLIGLAASGVVGRRIARDPKYVPVLVEVKGKGADIGPIGRE